MHIESTLKKAGLLIEQSRYELAEKELRSALIREPQQTAALRMLASCLLNMNRREEALETSSGLLGLQPDEPDNLYIHAVILLGLDRDKEAERYVRDAIRLYPYEASYFEVLSRVYLVRKEWEHALQYANEGLQIDPDHIGCLNARTISLTKLNRKQEASQTIENVLEQDPENAYSHANIGWSKLEQGDHTGAQVHFAEALRLEPGLDYARSGMMEALKAKNIIYKLFLRFFFWMGTLKGKAQWGVVIASYLGFKFLRKAAEANPALIPVAVLVGVFFYLTWIIDPLFNLFLRLDKYGRYILNEKETEGANWVGVLLGITLLALGVWYFASIDDLLLLAIFTGTMVIPIAHLYRVDTPKQKRIIKPYTLILAGIGIAGLICLAFGWAPAYLLGMTYLLGIVAFGWVANALVIK
jgi:tetratricopeptide (TPR) repeat protein